MKNLALILSMILLLLGGCKYFKKQAPDNVDMLTADTSEAESTFDSSAYYTETPIAETQPQTPVQSGPVAGKYYLIVGSFKVDANTDRYAEKMRTMGYDVQVIPFINDFELVSVRSYDSYRECLSEIEKFRDEITPDAWVYRH